MLHTAEVECCLKKILHAGKESRIKLNHLGKRWRLSKQIQEKTLQTLTTWNNLRCMWKVEGRAKEMNLKKLERISPPVDRFWRRKRTQTWPNVPLSELSKLNGWNPLATIPESDAVKSSEKSSGRRARAKTVSDLRVRIQDELLRKIILDVLTSYLSQFSQYDHTLFGRLGPLLSELIKVRVEECIEGRCKIVSQVYIGAVVGEGIDAATQCLWTPHCDKYATASYGTQFLFAVGIVFVVQL